MRFGLQINEERIKSALKKDTYWDISKKCFFFVFLSKQKKMPITNVELDYIFRNRKRFLEHYLNYIFTFKIYYVYYVGMVTT